MNIIATSIRMLVICCLSITATTQAQTFPDRVINLVVPYSAGGSTDVTMRALADLASKHLGQRIIVENRAGAGGTLGPAWMANQKPDGYTVAQMPITVFRYPHMTQTTFNPMTDFTWILHISGYTFGVVVRADAPWKTWKELIAYAKANPGKVTYSTPGNGTSLHITMEEIARREGITWTQVPYKGYAEAGQALLGGHVMVTADSTGWAEMVDAGRMRLLVTWGPKRTKRWPNAPTLKDLGYDLVQNSPYGIAGPKNMDPKVVRVLHDAFKKALEDPEYQKILDRYDQDTLYMSGDEYAKFTRKIFEDEREIIKRMGLKL